MQSATDLLAACGTGAELVAIAAGNVEFATDFSVRPGRPCLYGSCTRIVAVA